MTVKGKALNGQERGQLQSSDLWPNMEYNCLKICCGLEISEPENIRLKYVKTTTQVKPHEGGMEPRKLDFRSMPLI